MSNIQIYIDECGGNEITKDAFITAIAFPSCSLKGFEMKCKLFQKIFSDKKYKNKNGDIKSSKIRDISKVNFFCEELVKVKNLYVLVFNLKRLEESNIDKLEVKDDLIKNIQYEAGQWLISIRNKIINNNEEINSVFGPKGGQSYYFIALAEIYEFIITRIYGYVETIHICFDNRYSSSNKHKYWFEIKRILEFLFLTCYFNIFQNDRTITKFDEIISISESSDSEENKLYIADFLCGKISEYLKRCYKKEKLSLEWKNFSRILCGRVFEVDIFSQLQHQEKKILDTKWYVENVWLGNKRI